MGWRREGEDQRQGAGKGDRIQAPGDRRLGVAPHCPPNINTLRFPCSDGPDNHPLSTGTIWRQGGRCGPYFISIKHKFTHLLARWKKKEKKNTNSSFPHFPLPDSWFTQNIHTCDQTCNTQLREHIAHVFTLTAVVPLISECFQFDWHSYPRRDQRTATVIIISPR